MTRKHPLVRAKVRRARPAKNRLRVERLEGRDVPTSVLYLDFGDNLPAGGFNLTPDQLKNTFANGGIQGPDLTTGQGSTNLAGTDNLNFQGLAGIVNVDYNGDGLTNAQDYTDLKNAVVQLTQRYYAPFDLTVQVAPTLDTTSSATYLTGISALLQQGSSAVGETDCYLFCGTMQDTTIGQDVGTYESLNGIAAATDIGGNNATDDSALVFGNTVVSGLGAAQWDTALAHDTSHESAHTFGLQHTSPTAGNNDLLTQTDVIRQGGSQGVALANFNTFTRFPLPTVSGSPATVDNYARLSNTNLLGPKAGFPVYVTGTGASDKITLTAGGGGTVNVKVQAFTDNTYATQIGSNFTYSVSTANGILIDSGFGDDQIIVSPNLGATITVRGNGGADTLIVAGTGSGSAAYTPGTNNTKALDDNLDLRGTVTAGTTTVNFQEFRATSQVAINNIPTVTLNGTTGDDAFTLSVPGANQVQTDGTVAGGVPMVPLVTTSATSYTIAAGTGNDSVTGDSANRNFNITGAGSGSITGIVNSFTGVESLVGGSGNDTFTFGASGSLTGTVNGGGGTDNVVGPNATITWSITGNNVGNIGTTPTATGFLNVESLTGGSGADTFQFADNAVFSGTVSGGSGADNLVGDNTGRAFVLSAQDAGSITGQLTSFTGINVLTGGSGNDTFTFQSGSSLVLPGNIDGGGGSDTIVGDDTARTFTVTGHNAGTVSPSAPLLQGSFTNVENLTGGAGADAFLFSGGTLDGNVNGGGGTNSLFGDNNGHTYTLDTANGGTITTLLGGRFDGIANLTAGSGDDTFQFANGGSLSGNIDAGPGNDLLIGDDGARTYGLIGTGTGTVSSILGGTFTNVESLQGGSGNDTLVVGQNGTLAGSFDGEGGYDSADLSAVLPGQALGVTATGSVDGFNVSAAPIAGGLDNINALTGTGAIDTLSGLDANTLWSVLGTNSGQYEDIMSTRTLDFSAVENLSGGNQNDQFVFANGGSLTGTIAGNAGADLVQGDDGGRTFDVAGLGAGTITAINPAGFTGIESLFGGAGADRLVVEAAGSLAGSFDGEGGLDTADLSLLASQQIRALQTGTTDGFDLSGGTAINGGFFNLDSLVGSLNGTTDLLTGLDNDGTYDVNTGGGGTYTDNPSERVLNFAHFENLTGGSGNDLLIMEAAGFLGGAFDGMGGYDTANLEALGSQAAVIANTGAADGYDISGITAVGGGLHNLQALIGPDALNNKLTGRNFDATWDVSRVDGGQYRDVSANTLDFDNWDNLQGGTGNDLLRLDVEGSLDGSFDGGLGTDMADFTNADNQHFLVAKLGAQDGYVVTNVPLVAGDLKNIDALVGSNGQIDEGPPNNSLTGMGTNSTFTLTGTDLGTYVDNASARVLSFRTIENLFGGVANDLLVVQPAGTLAGTFDGGFGVDTADLSALSAVQQISILSLGASDGFNTTGGTNIGVGADVAPKLGIGHRGHVANQMTLGFLNLDRLLGGKSASATIGSSDRLTGENADSNWEVKAGTDASFYQDVASGRKLIFANFEELYGAASRDAFTVDFSAGNPVGTTGLTVDGQAGYDSVNAIGQATHNGFKLTGKTFVVNKNVIRYANFEKLQATGGNANDSFYSGNASLPKMLGLVEFDAGGGNDTATVSPTVLSVLRLDGGSGTNTLYVLNTGQHFLAPIPPKSVVSGTYLFSNRARIDFINWQIRNIGILQPQP